MIPGIAIYYWFESKRLVVRLVIEGDTCHRYDLRTNELLDSFPAHQVQFRRHQPPFTNVPEVLIVERKGVELGRISAKDP